MTPMTPHNPKSKWISPGVIAVLVGGVLVLTCCLGTVAAIALPNFLTFNKRAITSEVKSNLKAAYTAERSYWMEKDEYSESLEQVGFMPERGNRYRYIFAVKGGVIMPGEAADGGMHAQLGADLKKDLYPGNAALLSGVPAPVLSEAGIHGTCPNCNITIIAVGNIDSDATADVWSISTEDRTISGEKVSAGQPYCHVNDVNL